MKKLLAALALVVFTFEPAHAIKTIMEGIQATNNAIFVGTTSPSGYVVVGGTLTVKGSAFGVGGSSFTVSGGSATVAYGMTATSFIGNGAALTGVTAAFDSNTISSSFTVQGNAFSVGGSTLAVNGGNVYISTGIPSSTVTGENVELVVAGGITANNTPGIGIWSTRTSATGRIGSIYALSGATGTVNSSIDFTKDSGDGNGQITLNPHLNGGSSNAVTIKSSGKVGIGTTNPDAPLRVNGATGATVSYANSTIDMSITGGTSLYFGELSGSPFDFWLQTSNTGADSTQYPLSLNPLGGNIGLKTTTTAGTQLEYCNGGANIGVVCRGSGCPCVGGSEVGLGIYVP